MLSRTVIPIAEFPAGTLVSDNDIHQSILSDIVKKILFGRVVQSGKGSEQKKGIGFLN